MTKGNALPPSSSENKDNSVKPSSPIHLNENTSNNKNQQYVEKHLRSLSFLPSEVCCSLSFSLSLSTPPIHTQELKNALQRLRAVADSIEGNKVKIPREMDSILSEIDGLYRKESSKTNRSNSFYAMVMDCFENIPSQRTCCSRMLISIIFFFMFYVTRTFFFFVFLSC